MGLSQYDPAFRERPIWNVGKKVGAKRPLKQRRVWEIRFMLSGNDDPEADDVQGSKARGE